MKKYIEITGVIAVFFFLFLTTIKTSFFQNKELKANKLHQYFKTINTNDKTEFVDYEVFVADSLLEIKKNSSNVRFVEVSQFTDSLSIRFLTSNKRTHSYYAKFNAKKSKHIGTTYISAQQVKEIMNTDLKKMISILEFNLIYKSFSKPKELIGDYVANNIQKYAVFSLSGGEYVNNTTTNLGKSKYEFEPKSEYNESLYMVEHLLNNYKFTKFEELWKNGFSNFEKIYKKSYAEVNNARKKLRLLTVQNQQSFNCEYFNESI